MSYRIDHGFLFSLTDLAQVHQHMMDLRQEVAPLVYRKTADWLARNATLNLDRCRLRIIKSADPPLTKAYFELIDRQTRVRKENERSPDVDFSLDIAVLPFRGKVLGLYFTEQQDFVDLIRSKPWFVDYGYQNVTDPNADVPEGEWNRRRDDWVDLLGKDTSYKMLGFTAEISSIELKTFPKLRDILARIPAFEQRVRAMTRVRLFEQFAQTLPEPLAGHNLVASVSRFNEWAQSRAGRRKWKSAAAEIEPWLAKRVTIPHLTGWSRRKKKTNPK